ncbi:MAG: peptidylprolyl isomerase [Candidatus Aenigmarchaeota archaeon]|nr:peptidylprolyl isomerase [Candidatus Aenigmarchaeota archaeon]
MQKGDFILIDFVGKIKLTDEVFDLTIESEAKKAGIYNEKKEYKPVLVIMGAGNVVSGVEKQLEKMKPGEEKNFSVNPEDGFGKRNPLSVKIVSIKKFLEKNINPVPGIYVDIGGIPCRIQSVSGGRVRVDFNHPLAGKELGYNLKIVKKLSGAKIQIESILEKFEIKGTVTVKEKNVDIKLEGKSKPELNKPISEFIKKWVKDIKKINFK